MSESSATSLPAFARVISHPGGAWRRWWLHLVLPMTAKRMTVIDADIGKLRMQQAAFDARVGASARRRGARRLTASVRAAAKVHAAGVPVELEIWDGMAHVFQSLGRCRSRARR